jgi:hypothetical protein
MRAMDAAAADDAKSAAAAKGLHDISIACDNKTRI